MAMDESSFYIFDDDCASGGMNMTFAEAEFFMYGRGAIFYIQCILPFLLLVGLLDNTAFIYVVTKQSSMKTPTNRYLVNLAISDIVFLVSAIGEKIWKITHSPLADDDTSIGPVGCILLPFLCDTAYFASLYFVTLVSAEIFFAVCYPKGKSMFQQRIWSLWLALLAWIVSGITAGFLAFSNSNIQYVCFAWEESELTSTLPNKLTICGTNIKWLRSLIHIIQIVPFFITLFLNIFLYTQIVVGLNRSIERLRSHTPGRRDGDTHLRNQIARMLVVNGIVFFILLAPFEILSFLEAFQVHIRASNEGLATGLTRGLMYFNSVVNPIIYMAMSQRYREAFRNAFSPTPNCRFLGSSSLRNVQQNSTQTYFKMSQTTTRI